MRSTDANLFAYNYEGWRVGEVNRSGDGMTNDGIAILLFLIYL
jgi:hypothetical protein